MVRALIDFMIQEVVEWLMPSLDWIVVLKLLACNNAGFKVMCSGIGLFIGSHFGCIVFVNLKGEILYEAR